MRRPSIFITIGSTFVCFAAPSFSLARFRLLSACLPACIGLSVPLYPPPPLFLLSVSVCQCICRVWLFSLALPRCPLTPTGRLVRSPLPLQPPHIVLLGRSLDLAGDCRLSMPVACLVTRSPVYLLVASLRVLQVTRATRCCCRYSSRRSLLSLAHTPVTGAGLIFLILVLALSSTACSSHLLRPFRRPRHRGRCCRRCRHGCRYRCRRCRYHL